MKRLVVATLVFLFALPFTVYAQEAFYYSDNRKIQLREAESWRTVQVPEMAVSALTAALNRHPDLRLRKALDADRELYWIERTGRRALSADVINQLSQQIPIQRTFPAFFRVQDRDTTHFVMTDEFRVQFKPGVSRAEIDSLNEKYGVELAPLESEIDERQARDYNEYVLRVTEQAERSTLEVANQYYRSSRTVWALPNFHVNFRRPGTASTQSVNDPLYDQQYHLNNTSSNLGTADVDIDAPEAWELETGSPNVTVAVIDDGVESHEDFYSGQLVNGYTAVGSGNGAPGFGDKHGQSVAGIVAANHNGTGVRGVTSSVQIMPVKIFNPDASADEIEDAIDHAWQNGADVLNNSWGARTEGVYDDGIASAISRAQSNGRNGQGSVVVVSAGNTANAENGVDGFVSFPATVDGVLAVGAVDRNGNPSNYTPRNDLEVDLVAPSSRYIRDQYEAGDVTTMDRMGSSGYESGNYNSQFGGTSAAAPQVAGTAALVLSRNPNLTEQEVRTIIEDSADDYGSTNWNGNGRLNAYGAVSSVDLNVTLSGPSIVNSGQEGTWTADIEGGEGSTSYSWSVREPGATSWTGICSGQTCSYTFTNFSTYVQDVEIRVTVDKGSETDTDSQWVTVSPGAPGCEPWMIECPSTQLANLRSFEAEPQGESAQLAWTTTGSMGEGAFRVQHRADSTAAWSDLQTVEVAERTQVDSTDAPTYQVATEALAPGPHQFRLQWVAGSETVLLSDVVEAEITLEDPYRLRAYPNPAGAQMTVESAVKERQHVRMQIYDVLGRRVTTVYDGPMVPNEVKHFTVQPGADGLSSGTYFLRMTGEQFQTTTRISVVR
ncbi:S8 family serine peptidase [Longimonas halophila]|nr:S8 family serine peptidase [Longimonas halophila]